MKKEIKEYRKGDKNPFMSEEEYSVNSQKNKKVLGRMTHLKENSSDILNSKEMPEEAVVGLINALDDVKNGRYEVVSNYILNSKEQKICEKTTCRNCKLNNCGCKE